MGRDRRIVPIVPMGLSAFAAPHACVEQLDTPNQYFESPCFSPFDCISVSLSLTLVALKTVLEVSLQIAILPEIFSRASGCKPLGWGSLLACRCGLHQKGYAFLM